MDELLVQHIKEAREIMDRQDRNNVVESHYNRHADKLISLYTYRRDNNRMDGEDIVHNAYARALQVVDKFNPEVASFEAWFGTILERAEKDFLSSERRQGMSYDKKVALHEEDEDGEAVVSMAVEAVESAHKALDIVQDVHGIRKMILRQPVRLHKPLLLYYVYQYSLKDITALLGLEYKQLDNMVKDFRNRAIREKGLC